MQLPKPGKQVIGHDTTAGERRCVAQGGGAWRRRVQICCLGRCWLPTRLPPCLPLAVFMPAGHAPKPNPLSQHLFPHLNTTLPGPFIGWQATAILAAVEQLQLLAAAAMAAKMPSPPGGWLGWRKKLDLLAQVSPAGAFSPCGYALVTRWHHRPAAACQHPLQLQSAQSP